MSKRTVKSCYSYVIKTAYLVSQGFCCKGCLFRNPIPDTRRAMMRFRLQLPVWAPSGSLVRMLSEKD